MASIWKQAACVGLVLLAAGLSGCGKEKAAYVDYGVLQQKSEKIKAVMQEVNDKDKEITDRLMKESETTGEEEMQQKLAAAQQERQIFLQSKTKEIQLLVETECAAVAKEKDIGIVMHKMAIPAGAVDITEDVLKRIDGAAAKAKK